MFRRLLLLSTLIFTISSASANTMAKAKITVQPAAGNVYMLQGPGGNIGVLATKQGLLMVDDKFAPLAEKIEQAMKGIADKPLKYIVNTHYHGDHTGANGHFAQHAPVFAHENVRTRLQAQQKSAENLPVVTYKNGVTIYLAEEEVQLTHLPAGHTDSDSYVYFKQSNVLHTGDLFFQVGFPYVDLKGGGNVRGYLSSVKHMLTHVPDDVVIIPGHGKLTNKAELQAFADMIEYSINHVAKQLSEGKTTEQILAQGIGEQYQHLSWAFITEEKWLKTLITDLK